MKSYPKSYVQLSPLYIPPKQSTPRRFAAAPGFEPSTRRFRQNEELRTSNRYARSCRYHFHEGRITGQSGQGPFSASAAMSASASSQHRTPVVSDAPNGSYMPDLHEARATRGIRSLLFSDPNMSPLNLSTTPDSKDTLRCMRQARLSPHSDESLDLEVLRVFHAERARVRLVDKYVPTP